MSDKNPLDGKDEATIIVAVVSLVGTLIVAGITIWSNFLSDKRKRLTETEKVVKKYRDPLLLATQELQSRLWGITQDGRLNWFHRCDDDGQRKDNLVGYTCFLVGQFFSWTYILHRQVQFLDLGSDEKSLQLTLALDSIQLIFSKTRREPNDNPFCLWRNEQLAMGERMTVKEENGELFCIGYAAFCHKWEHDMIFKGWFRSLVEGITTMALASKQPGVTVPDHRLRRLQHKLVDLIHILDPKKLRSDKFRMDKCDPAASSCECSTCDPSPPAPGCTVCVG